MHGNFIWHISLFLPTQKFAQVYVVQTSFVESSVTHWFLRVISASLFRSVLVVRLWSGAELSRSPLAGLQLTSWKTIRVCKKAQVQEVLPSKLLNMQGRNQLILSREAKWFNLMLCLATEHVFGVPIARLPPHPTPLLPSGSLHLLLVYAGGKTGCSE